jgi:hypothetical protein
LQVSTNARQWVRSCPNTLLAFVYVRQSTAYQVANNLESQRRQYGLVERARQLGWEDVQVVDDDLGKSDRSASELLTGIEGASSRSGVRCFFASHQEENWMRKLLLASVAALGTVGLVGAAHAQAPAAPMPMNPVQGGFVSAPLPSPPVGANNNNNAQAPALPGVAANPTPGTVVLHLNGLVGAEFGAATH